MRTFASDGDESFSHTIDITREIILRFIVIAYYYLNRHYVVLNEVIFLLNLKEILSLFFIYRVLGQESVVSQQTLALGGCKGEKKEH
ncbi:hypothetical protein ACJX0J_005838 [Zea mays]